MADSPWKSLDTAPRSDAHGNRVPILLFLPSAFYHTDREGRPSDVAHARVVGWWDSVNQHWVTGFNPNDPPRVVYPSLWADLPDEPIGVPVPAGSPAEMVAPQPEAPAANPSADPQVRPW